MASRTPHPLRSAHWCELALAITATALVAAANDEYVLEDARFRQGIDPFLNSLEAQRTLYASRRTLATTRLVQAQNLVALYRTLGGDQLIDARQAPKSLLP